MTFGTVRQCTPSREPNEGPARGSPTGGVLCAGVSTGLVRCGSGPWGSGAVWHVVGLDLWRVDRRAVAGRGLAAGRATAPGRSATVPGRSGTVPTPRDRPASPRGWRRPGRLGSPGDPSGAIPARWNEAGDPTGAIPARWNEAGDPTGAIPARWNAWRSTAPRATAREPRPASPGARLPDRWLGHLVQRLLELDEYSSW